MSAAKHATEAPIRTLTCCVCGDSTRGRQWWNRDEGYGICTKCSEWTLRHRPFGHDPMSAEEHRKLYGVHGVHYSVSEPDTMQEASARLRATLKPVYNLDGTPYRKEEAR